MGLLGLEENIVDQRLRFEFMIPWVKGKFRIEIGPEEKSQNSRVVAFELFSLQLSEGFDELPELLLCLVEQLERMLVIEILRKEPHIQILINLEPIHHSINIAAEWEQTKLFRCLVVHCLLEFRVEVKLEFE